MGDGLGVSCFVLVFFRFCHRIGTLAGLRHLGQLHPLVYSVLCGAS